MKRNKNRKKSFDIEVVDYPTRIKDTDQMLVDGNAILKELRDKGLIPRNFRDDFWNLLYSYNEKN